MYRVGVDLGPCEAAFLLLCLHSPFPSVCCSYHSLGSLHFISFRLLSFYWLCTILESSCSSSYICAFPLCVSQEVLYTIRVKRSIQWWTNVRDWGINLWNWNAFFPFFFPIKNRILWWECMKFWKCVCVCFGKSLTLAKKRNVRKRLLFVLNGMKSQSSGILSLAN